MVYAFWDTPKLWNWTHQDPCSKDGCCLSSWMDPSKSFFTPSLRWKLSIQILWVLHPWKLTCPLKRDYFSRECIFQPLILRGHLRFQGHRVFDLLKDFASRGFWVSKKWCAHRTNWHEWMPPQINRSCQGTIFLCSGIWFVRCSSLLCLLLV